MQINFLAQLQIAILGNRNTFSCHHCKGTGSGLPLPGTTVENKDKEGSRRSKSER